MTDIFTILGVWTAVWVFMKFIEALEAPENRRKRA